LVDQNFRAKLADFGLSVARQSRDGAKASGTPFWMAPELLRGESTNTASSDVYSLGIVLYEMYSRKDPYEGEEYLEVVKEVCDPMINKRPPVPVAMPACIAALMQECLVATPDERPTPDEIASRVKRFEDANVEPIGMKKKVKPGEESFDLLLKMFPKHIAEALRDGRRPEPENHDCVTIFFSGRSGQ